MNKRTIYWVVAALGLTVAGWLGHAAQRDGLAAAWSAQSARVLVLLGRDARPAPEAVRPAAAPIAAAGTTPAGGATSAAGAAAATGAAAGRARPGGPVAVEVARVETVALSEEVGAVGALRANESVTLRPEVAGRIARIHFSDGARVARGAPLIALDAAVAAAELEQARAELALAQANHQRTSELFQKNFVSGRARDEAAAALKVLEAKLQLAEARLARHEIRAPFTGVMGLRNISVGDYVKDGAELALLEDVSSMKVDLRLPERYVGRLRRGQPIELTLDAFAGRTFIATLDAVDVQVDANGRSVVVRGRLANPDAALRTGMFARARVVLGRRDDALMIPEEALIPEGREVWVYRVQGERAARTRVEIGQRRDGQVEVVAGLQAADLVVTAGQQRLGREGAEIRIAGAPRAADAAPAAAARPH